MWHAAAAATLAVLFQEVAPGVRAHRSCHPASSLRPTRAIQLNPIHASGPSAHLTLPAPDSLLRILSFMQIKQRQQHRQLREFLAYFMGPAHCQLLFDAVMPIETVAIIAIV